MNYLEKEDVDAHLWLRFKFEFRYWVGQYPALFFPLKKAFGENLENMCSLSTELVIEGFPRSANSFAVFAFRMAQNRDVRIAHHIHAPAQIIYAVKNNIPTLILIRKPVEVILALMVMHPWISPKIGLRAYERFYRRIQPYLKGAVLATFEEVTSDFGQVIRRVNQKFGTSFCEFKHSPENVNQVFLQLEERARQLRQIKGKKIEGFGAFPSESKEIIKNYYRMYLDSESTRKMLERCNRVYEECISESTSRRNEW